MGLEESLNCGFKPRIDFSRCVSDTASLVFGLVSSAPTPNLPPFFNVFPESQSAAGYRREFLPS